MGCPLDVLSGGSKRLIAGMDQTEDGQSGVRERCERLRQAGPLGVVTIFVPPAVFNEVQAVFHLPVPADVALELFRRDQSGIQAGYEVPAFAGKKLALGRTHFTIDSGGDLAAGNVQTLSDILGIVEVDPKPPRLVIEPLFSVTSCVGLMGVS